MNNLALLMALATAPSSAFAELRERPRFWFPLLLLVFTTVGLVYWYYSVVDIDWLKDLMFGNNPGLNEAQRNAAMGMMTRTTLTWSSVISAFLIVPIVALISALYWWLAAKVTKLSPGYKHWFAFSCWTAMPALIGTIIAAILLLMRDNAQFTFNSLQALSLNELIFHRPFGAPGQNFFDALGVLSLLSWALMIIGVHVWSQRSWLFSTVFVLLPVAAFYGGWSLIAFR